MRPSPPAAVTLALVVSISVGTAGTDPGYQYTFLAGALPDTLHALDSPFMVLSDVYPSDTTFVEAGVQMYFAASTKLNLTHGLLYAPGTTSSPVLLADAGLGYWDGIRVEDSGILRLTLTTVRGASQGLWVMFRPGGTSAVDLSGVSFLECSEGLSLHVDPYTRWGEYDLLSLIDLTFHDNERGLYVEGGFPDTLDVAIDGGEATYNEYGYYIDGGHVRVSDAAIHDNTAYDVYVRTPVTTSASQDFRHNDWGPTTTAEMQAEGIFSDISTIFDWWDNHSYSIVDYSGFSGGSTGVAGARVISTSWGSIKSMFR